jgi:hypothetical protein
MGRSAGRKTPTVSMARTRSQELSSNRKGVELTLFALAR